MSTAERKTMNSLRKRNYITITRADERGKICKNAPSNLKIKSCTGWWMKIAQPNWQKKLKMRDEN